MATAKSNRQLVADKYKTILGRNEYNQSRRTHVYKKYTDGKYYSDCSSSICYSYKESGFTVADLNTAGLYNSKDWQFVDVTIKNGQIVDVDKLRVGDILLYAGTDASRPRCIGHVEMVHKIDGATVTICGHGSGKPSTKNLKEYNTLRYNSKTKTPHGNKGLVCVKRFFKDDGSEKVTTKGNDWVRRLQTACNKLGYSNQIVDGIKGTNTLNGCPTLRQGSKNEVVKLLQEGLKKVGFEVGSIDGIFGTATLKAVKQFQTKYNLVSDGIFGKKSWSKLIDLIYCM